MQIRRLLSAAIIFFKKVKNNTITYANPHDDANADEREKTARIDEYIFEKSKRAIIKGYLPGRGEISTMIWFKKTFFEPFYK